MFCQDWLLVRFLSGLVSFLKWIFSHPSKDDSCASRSTAITVFTKLCFLFIRRMEKKVNQDSIWRLQFVYSTCDEIKSIFCCCSSSLSMKCRGHGLGHETFFRRKTDLLQWWCYQTWRSLLSTLIILTSFCLTLFSCKCRWWNRLLFAIGFHDNNDEPIKAFVVMRVFLRFLYI